MADPSEMSGPADRLSMASVRSSLPSIMGEGEEGGGEDTWTHSMSGIDYGMAATNVVEEEINWKERYEKLEMSVSQFHLQATKIRDILKKRMAELEEQVWTAERKAAEAERKAQAMEQKLTEIKNDNSSGLPCCNKSLNITHRESCVQKDCIISALEQQVEEQLEEQNQLLREQNQKCNAQLELLKSHWNKLSHMNSKSSEKSTKERGSTEDSSRGSFEDHIESDDSLPPPEVLDYPVPNTSEHADFQQLEDVLCNFSTSKQDLDQNDEPSNILYASVDYSSKKYPYNCQMRAAPPGIKLERKRYNADVCLTPSTVSTTSEHRYSETDFSSWNRTSPKVNSCHEDVDMPSSILSPTSSTNQYNADRNFERESDDLNQRKLLSSSAQTHLCQGIDYSASGDIACNQSCSERPLLSSLAGNSDNEEFFDHFAFCNHMQVSENVLALNNLAYSINKYKDSTCDEDELHDYAEIYTPNKERPDFYTDMEDCESVLTDDITTFPNKKPPTPPLHRFPSWESRIYEVAENGINVSSDTAQIPIDSSNNNQTKLHESSHYSNTAFTELNIPVYATVKGRASQIRSVPFTGDSSDSSDNEDIRVTMTTTSSQTTSGDTESSTSASIGIGENSPIEKKTFSNNRSSVVPSPSPYPMATPVLSRRERHGSMSPLRAVYREKSTESMLSEDYAIPPDAVSFDVVSLSSLDNTNATNTPTSVRRAENIDKTNKRESLEKCGYLTKLGGKFKTWRRRWFVLKNGILSYYKSQADISRKPQGQIVLDNVCRVSRAEGAATFEISTGKKTYYLTADSINLMEEWIKVLQNVLRQNAIHLLLTKEGTKPTAEGWLTKVKHGHSRRCWCVLVGRILLYFRNPNDSAPLGQINMRDAKVEEVIHVSDSDEDERDHNKVTKSEYTIGIFPSHQGPTYLLMDNKQEMDLWMYHLTVVSSGDNLVGTQYEQLIAKLMEVDGEENSVIWRHPLLLYSKENISQPLTTLPSEQLQLEAVKLFKSLQLFISVPLDTSGIEYHVALAQNALHQCLLYPELQNELFCQLIKQTSRHSHQKIGVQQLLICATQSLFLCDTSSSDKTSPTSSGSTEKTLPTESKLNPAPFVFIQAWQLLALAVSLFVPKNRTLWYLRKHLQRNAYPKLEAGKYAIFCQRALERALSNGGRECKPSRMEVLSILLKNPYHHSLPHSIPVHFSNQTYQVFGFDGSTTVYEFMQTVNRDLGIRESEYSGFALFSDDPVEKHLEHCLLKEAKICDVISQWEQALREKHLGKFENTKVVKLTYKNRIVLRQNVKAETDKERLLLVYQINSDIIEGKFPLTKELAIELAALLAQVEFGDFPVASHSGIDVNGKPHLQLLQVMDNFFPKKFKGLNDRQIQDIIKEKWLNLRGHNSSDCVRIYLNCVRKWSFCGGKFFPAKLKSDQQSVWLTVAENCIAVLDITTMQVIAQYPYSSVMTFGGCCDDFMLVVSSENSSAGRSTTERLIFSMAKPKILELTLLIADYINAIAQINNKRATVSTFLPSSSGSLLTVNHPNKVRSKSCATSSVQSQNCNATGIVSINSTSPEANRICPSHVSN